MTVPSDIQQIYLDFFGQIVQALIIFNVSAPVVKWESTNHALRRIRKTVGDSVILNCRMNDPNVRVKLKQKVALGAMRERITDGCRVSRHGQTFVIHAVNFKDFGIYYCEAPHLKIKRKEEAYLEVQPGKVINVPLRGRLRVGYRAGKLGVYAFD